MLDIKALKVALEQLEQEKKISHEKVVDAVEKSLAAAYQKEYGKRGQIVRCGINFDTGETDFEQVKIVVDETTVRMVTEEEDALAQEAVEKQTTTGEQTEELLPRYNEERHILLSTAKLLKKNAELGEAVLAELSSGWRKAMQALQEAGWVQATEVLAGLKNSIKASASEPELNQDQVAALS